MELYLEPEKIFERKFRKTNGQFKKGHRPWNKGLKGIKTGGNITQFKIGHKPHNTKYDGYVSKRWHKRDERYYLWIRISNGKWMAYNRYVYEKYFGPIPKNNVIRYKDGNTLNCNIENLECISRAENRNRNINYEKSSETLKKIWKKEKIRQEYGLPRQTKLRIK